MRFVFDGKGYSLSELQESLAFRFLPRIDFKSPEERAEILERGLQKKDVKPQELEMGKRFCREIEDSYIPSVSIRTVNENVGYGLFAEEPLKKSSYVGEYTGIVRRNNMRYLEPINDYCYRYPLLDHLGMDYVIDAAQGHLTRFVNHSQEPNLKPMYAYSEGFYHLILIALREICPGEQLSFDYGSSYWYLRSCPELI